MSEYVRLSPTSCQVYLLTEPVGKTRALVRMVLNEQIQLTGMRIIDGANGLFLSFPNDPSYKGEDYRSIYYPITKELRDLLERVALKKYGEAIGDPTVGSFNEN